MIRIFLREFELAHFEDLTSRMPTVFKLPNHETAEGQRDLKLRALEQVVGMDRPRERISDKAFEVFLTRSTETRRWQ